MDWDDMVQSNYIPLILMYGGCRAKHRDLVEAWNRGAEERR